MSAEQFIAEVRECEGSLRLLPDGTPVLNWPGGREEAAPLLAMLKLPGFRDKVIAELRKTNVREVV